MALEYVLYAAAELSTEEFLRFMATAVDGEILGNYARADALDVTAYRDDDPAPIAELLGFTHRVTATFRISGGVDDDALRRAENLMLRAVLRFIDTYAAPGVLLFNDEEIVLQKSDGLPVLVNSEWEWADPDTAATLLTGRVRRQLDQPLL